MTNYRSIGLLALFALCGLTFASNVEAQLFPRLRARMQPVCQDCYAPTVYSVVTPAEIVQETSSDDLGETTPLETSNAEWARSAAQIKAGNSCGSGSVVGFYRDGTLLLTNAHVVGTRPGTAAKIRMVVDGVDRSFEGQIIMAAYSNTYLADWAIVYVPEIINVQPRPLSTLKPKGSHVTVGSPKCVWPLRFSELRTADASNNSALWRWMPNSIPGQSGSGVWSIDDGNQYGLLTWSWNGFGAGQQTWWIYEQAKKQSAEVGELRPEGLKELAFVDSEKVVEEGFFVQSNIGDLPIWATPEDPKPEPAPPITPDASEDERKIFEKFRQWCRERNINWAQLLLLLMELFKLLQGR